MFRMPFTRRYLQREATNKAAKKRPYRTRLSLEPLEERTLLDGDYMNIGAGLYHIATALQSGLNDHLLNPKAGFSLPVLGTDLSAGAGQFLGNLATQLQSLTATDYKSLNSQVQTIDKYASVSPNQGGGGIQQTEANLELTITNQPVQLATLMFQLGLPGLDKATTPLANVIQQVENKLQINGNDLSLTYSANVFFKVDSNAQVTLDTTQNGINTPLVSVTLSASYDNTQSPLTVPLIPSVINVSVAGSGSLTFGATLSDALPNTYNATSSVPTLTTTVALGPDSQNNPAQAKFDLKLTVAANNKNFPSLFADLDVDWPLAATNPFDSSALKNSKIEPTISFDVGIASLSTLAGWLNPILDGIKKQLAPIEPIVDTLKTVLETKIPILGDLLPQFANLEDILKNNPVKPIDITPLVTFLDAVDGILHYSDQAFSLSGPDSVTLASYTLPDDDPRTNVYDLGKLLNQATSNILSGGQSQLAQLAADIQAVIPAGTLSLPLLTNPLGDLHALLLGENVVLVQYQFPHLDLSTGNITIGPFPIVPPLALALDLGFGISGDLTIGYDTYGFSADWAKNQNTYDITAGNTDAVSEGIFVTAPSDLQLTGEIGLSAEAHFGIIQVGGTGTLKLSFGITGLHESTLFPIKPRPQNPPNGPDVHPYHAALFPTQNDPNNAEKVLQFGDLKYDFDNGGPLCPFDIGGSISIGLSAFVTVGVGPFSVTVNVDFGNITIASFTIDTCSGNTMPVQLAEPFNSPNDPTLVKDLSGLPKINPNWPGSAGAVDTLLKKADPNYGGTQQFLLLDLGQFHSNLQADNLNQGQDNETFEISPVANSNDLQVSAYGLAQKFPDLNAGNVTILAFGGTGAGNVPENITVDQGVHANVAFFGGANENDFEEDGDGACYMAGGTWDGQNDLPENGKNNGSPYSNMNKDGLQTLNTLRGGSGHNYLLGGGLSDNQFPNAQERTVSWNVLSGGANGFNTLQGGTAGATLRGGDINADIIRGSLDPNAGKSSYTMVDGEGNDVMYGGYGFNIYQWGENVKDQNGKLQPHNLTVYGSALQGIVNNDGQVHDEVDAQGNRGFESWTIAPDTNGQGVRISSDDGQIDAYAVQAVGVDAHDAKNTGGENYLIDDLSRTGVTKVNVNLHQFTTYPDKNADHVTALGAQGSDTVTVGVTGIVDKFDPQTGQPIYSSEYTDITMATTLADIGSTGGRTVQYDIFTAVPKKTDTLTIDAFGGDDTVSVKATQPDQTSISTGAGNDTINVGAGLLDDIEGPLVVDAGAGHNQVVFNDFASVTADIATLATSLKPISDPQLGKLQDSLLGSISAGLSDPKGYLLRYKGAFIPGGGPAGTELPPHYRFPLGITFLASGGGDFTPTNGKPGVIFNATVSKNPDMIYVDSLLPNAPTAINTYGGADQVYVGFDGGPSGAVSDPNGTLDYLASLLSVNDTGPYQATLFVDDEGTQRPDTYDLTAKAPQPNGNGSVNRVKVPVTIDYDSFAALILRTPVDQDNTIHVTGTVLKTATTLLCGDGNNTLSVGDASDRLDNVLGPLTINGSKKGQDDLTINDQGNGQSQVYSLSDTNLTRQAIQPVSITFHDLHSLTFNASAANNNSIKVAGTPANVRVAINPGPGKGDQLNLIDLDNFKGPLSLLWGQGVKNVLVDDTGTKAAQTYTLTANGLVRSGAKPISFSPMLVLVLDVGLTHPDTVKVQAIHPANQVQIAGGNIGTTVLVADSSNDLNDIQGPLAIYGPGGAVPTQVTVEDQKASAGRNNYVLSSFSLQAGSLPNLSFGNLTQLTLDATRDRGNQISVSGTAAGTDVTINAGTKDSIAVSDSNHSLQAIQGPLAVVGQGPEDLVAIDDTGGNGFTTYGLTATVVDHPLTAAISYKLPKGTLKLAGSAAGVDLYRVKSTPADTTVQIVAAGLGNTLDYSSYSGSVVVNLRTGFATGLGGGVSGIQNIKGGSSGPAGTYNLLIGNGGNTLQGGTGRRNILVAGATASTLKGGNQDDLLIGGTTDYDTQAGLASWLQIAAYWAGSDPYATRVSHLEQGTGVPKLAASTVQGNGGKNQLFGNGELALLFSDGLDKIITAFDPNSKAPVKITP